MDPETQEQMIEDLLERVVLLEEALVLMDGGNRNEQEKNRIVDQIWLTVREQKQFDEKMATGDEKHEALNQATDTLDALGIAYGGRGPGGEYYSKNVDDLASITISTEGEESWSPEELEAIACHKRACFLRTPAEPSQDAARAWTLGIPTRNT